MGLVLMHKKGRRCRCCRRPPRCQGRGGGMGSLQKDTTALLFLTHVQLLVKTALDMQYGLNALRQLWGPEPRSMTACLQSCMPRCLWQEEYHYVHSWMKDQQKYLDFLFRHLGTLLVEDGRAQGRLQGLQKYLSSIRPSTDIPDSEWKNYYTKAGRLSAHVEEVLKDKGTLSLASRAAVQNEVRTLTEQLEAKSPKLIEDIQLARSFRTCHSEAAATPASAHSKCLPECRYCCCHVALRPFRYAAACFLILVVLVVTAGVHFTEPNPAARYYEGVQDAKAALLPFVNPNILEANKTCPEKWISFRKHCFFFFSDFLNWESSLANCKYLNASLAIFHDTEALDMVKTLAGPRRYWIGLHFRGERWKWVDGKDGNSVFPTFKKDNKKVSKACAAVNVYNITYLDCKSQHPWICTKSFPKTIVK
ncbi:hypothetical protein NDU88_000539 [Pleurodeles waltl]|uniref:C-type lectin domain-containing protein n=1 Tax=Pleurodeles waltl TaxID=8319 RepID=A0AAV7P157_PLEWA|nr:hypothetical protein NDU88_000539 [Pleurodeles waltl]